MNIKEDMSFGDFWNYCLEFKENYEDVISNPKWKISFAKWVKLMANTEWEKNTGENTYSLF